MAAGIFLASDLSAADAEDVLALPARAPDGLTVQGQVRARAEEIGGQFRPDAAEEDLMLSLRTTIQVEYDGGHWQVGGELWDSRAYGESADSSAGTGEVDALALVQAYVGFDLGGQADTHVTIGRFTMNLGSRRLVARQSFRNTTNAFTGVNLQWSGPDGDQVALLWAMPQIRLPDDSEDIRDNAVRRDKETSDLQFYGGSLTKTGVLGGSLQIYGFGLSERDSAERPTRNRHIFTPGLRAHRSPNQGQLDYDVEGAYQFGRSRATSAPTDLTDLNVSAYFIHAEAGRTFDHGWTPRVSIDFDLASGDGASTKAYNRFDTLFGARRFDFGPTGLYGAVGRFNMISGGARVEVKPDTRSDVMMMYRALWLHSRTDSFSNTGVRDVTGNSGRFAGNQFEARYRRTLIPGRLRLDIGMAYLDKGHFLKAAPNAPQPATPDTGMSISISNSESSRTLSSDQQSRSDYAAAAWNGWKHSGCSVISLITISVAAGDLPGTIVNR
ncbi:alginate export family protein [Sphingobium naphthae]|uniref:Alginate export family protein n=1 Tax=Sphingobium naphthae TaxID=1886786 RepID=A0ABU3ZS94_9SPHN|nr:alginate export family protein [Sphingobium naphthae]MDV5822396.1 alginate export family protein [Sphingobium naphthae]